MTRARVGAAKLFPFTHIIGRLGILRVHDENTSIDSKVVDQLAEDSPAVTSLALGDDNFGRSIAPAPSGEVRRKRRKL